jgi:hypothetical protein
MDAWEMYQAAGGDVRDWLTNRLGKEEIEEARIRYFAMPWVAQKHWRDSLSKFLTRFESLSQDDEVWSFCSPPKTWEEDRGRKGVCIIRQGEVFAVLVTSLN